MFPEERDVSIGEAAGIQKNRGPLAAIVICSCLCVFFMNFGLLSLLFLVPLGYSVLVYNSARLTFFVVTAVNAVFCIIASLVSDSSRSLWMDFFYYSIVFFSFIWIIDGSVFKNVRTLYRFVLASAVGAVGFMLFIIGGRDSAFYTLMGEVAEMLYNTIVSSNGGDAVRQSSLQQWLTPERILETSRMILPRGGALANIFFLFFINRHISLALVRLIKKQEKKPGLTVFFAPDYTIWVISASLALILLTRLFKIELLEILAWNVFVVCAILFLTQGAGIVKHFLERRTQSFRVFFNILVIILMISPLGTVAIAALFLLGIAENWLPFRTPS